MPERLDLPPESVDSEPQPLTPLDISSFLILGSDGASLPPGAAGPNDMSERTGGCCFPRATAAAGDCRSDHKSCNGECPMNDSNIVSKCNNGCNP